MQSSSLCCYAVKHETLQMLFLSAQMHENTVAWLQVHGVK